MEVLEPVTREILPLVIGKRKIELPFETRGEVRELITALADLMARLPDDGSGLLALIAVGEDGVIQPGDEPEPLPRRVPGRSHLWPMVADVSAARCTECGITWAGHYDAPLCPGAALAEPQCGACGLPLTDHAADAGGAYADCPPAPGGTVPWAPSQAFAPTMAESAIGEAAGNGLLACPESHPATSAPCARLSGHEPPHRTLDRTEWDDGPAPYHAASGPQCAVRDDGYICTAQRGHGGAVHIAYGASGEVCHRWPVAAPERQDDEPRVNDGPHPDVVRDLLSLVGVTLPPGVIKGWDEAARREAAEWAAAEHLHASDNDDVARLPKPAHVAAYHNCGALAPGGDVRCTNRKGHDGPHDAGGPDGELYARWDDASDRAEVSQP